MLLTVFFLQYYEDYWCYNVELCNHLQLEANIQFRNPVSLIQAIIVIIDGIVLIGMFLFGTINTPSGTSAYMQGNVSYLLLLFVFFIPIGAVLFLAKKLHLGTSRYNIATSRYTKEESLYNVYLCLDEIFYNIYHGHTETASILFTCRIGRV